MARGTNSNPCTTDPSGAPMRRFVVLTLGVGLVVGGCQFQRLTASEAREALEESSLAQQASALTSASVEVSTNFTIGDAVENAAEEVRSFVQSQLPCAGITLSGATLSIVYGENPGSCTFNGHHFSGSHTITVVRNEMGEVLVQHVWDGFSNGVLEIDGHADVTWDFDDRQRRVEHEVTWTRLSDGRMGVGSGSRAQSPLAGGLAEGIQIDGERAWEGDAGRWSLDIDGVQMRWQDPVPQAGRYQLDTPFDKSLTVSFKRRDATSISVTVEGPRRSFTFHVNQLGLVSSED